LAVAEARGISLKNDGQQALGVPSLHQRNVLQQ